MGPYAQRGILHAGKHRIFYEDPGISIIEYGGAVTADEMRILCSFPDVEEYGTQFQLNICDMRNFGGVDSEGRKLAAQRPQPAAIYYAAYVGASFTMKAIVGMWARAMNILRGPKNVVAFFDDMASAKAWLIEKRAKHLESISGQ